VLVLVLVFLWTSLLRFVFAIVADIAVVCDFFLQMPPAAVAF
jgi:hypothetical protein